MLHSAAKQIWEKIKSQLTAQFAERLLIRENQFISGKIADNHYFLRESNLLGVLLKNSRDLINFL
jgi:hypothetical protein